MIYRIKLKIESGKLKKYRKQEGVTLMLAVLVLAAILAIAFSLATITFTEIRSSGDLVRTEPAFNAADAVAEEALFKVKRNVPDSIFTYSEDINNVSLKDPEPSDSYVSTPILQITVPRYTNDFTSSRVRFPVYNISCVAPTPDISPTCDTGGSGYGRLQVTYIDTGNTDSLKALLCEFDPRKPVDATGLDQSAYRTVPCSDPTDSVSGYWRTVTGGDILTNSDSNRTRSWSLDPYKQQELVLFNSGASSDIRAEIRAFDSNSIAKGLPLVGQKAVDINAVSGGVVRKVRAIIPLSGSSVIKDKYGHNRSITVNPALVSGTQNNFPLMVCFNGPAPCNQSLPDLKITDNGGVVEDPSGYDIIFTADSAGSVLLPFEREKYDPTTGQGVFWVKTDVTNSTTTQFYMFYGRVSAVDQQDKTAVWDGNYKIVNHFKETSGQVTDSTSNGNNGTPAGGASSVSGGAAGNAYSFNGSSGVVSIPYSDSWAGSDSKFTIDLWVKIKEIASYKAFLGVGNGGRLDLYFYTTSGMMANFMPVASGPYPPGMYVDNFRPAYLSSLDNTFHHIAYVFDGTAGTLSLYSDGVFFAASPYASGVSNLGPYPLCIGGYCDGSRLNSEVDELRVSKGIARSAGWILTEYNNIKNASSFYTIGPQQ